MNKLRQAISPALIAALLLAVCACGSGGSGGEVSSLERALIGRWQRTAGAAALPDALVFSAPPAGLAISGAAQTPFTWILAGNVLINTVGGQMNRATLAWADGNHITINDLTPGSGPSSWQRSP